MDRYISLGEAWGGKRHRTKNSPLAYPEELRLLVSDHVSDADMACGGRAKLNELIVDRQAEVRTEMCGRCAVQDCALRISE